MEIDPATGIKSDFKWNENDQQYTILRTADVEPVLDFTKSCANDLGLNRSDIKKGWWLYAKLPPIVIIQMRAKGINVYDKNDSERMFEEINQNYKFLKCTTGMQGANSSRKLYMPPNSAIKDSADSSVAQIVAASD